ncbi:MULTISPECIES: type IV pilus modification PilV family protein [Nocardioides]|uniref:Type II secretion system protein n=1 Tax=Nocardioides vastitatis TaxID=2568655 RepID=A0ABW0ZD95_9ACTN|nr:type II secretion system protein [Nocardioides sp.]
MDARPDLGSDAGATLVETLVALVILSLAAVAILAGVQLSVQASDMHRKQTTGGAYVRSYAEAIEKHVTAPGVDNYQPCAASNGYNVPAVMSQLDLPTGYTATHAAAVPLAGAGGPATCPDDRGVQKLQLTVRSTDNRAAETLTVILRRSCDPSVAPCTS